MRVSLVRTEFGLSETLGVLIVDGALTFCTLEPPWRDNRVSISSIPEGPYKCVRAPSASYGSVFWVKDVPLRSDIIMGHVGNTHRDSDGCIVLGMYPGIVDHQRAVMESRRAIAAWQVITEGVDCFDLQIWGIKRL